MNDPTRLLSEGTPLGKTVLASATADASPPDLRRKIHAALLVGAVGAGVGASSTATAATAATKGAAWVAGLTVTKCVGVVAVVAVVAVGTRAITQALPAKRAATPVLIAAPPSPQTRAPAAGRAAHHAPDPVVAPAAPQEERSPAAKEPLAQPASRIAPAVGSIPSARGVPAAEEPDFAREVVAIDAARDALAGHDADEAIERLNRHDLDFPHGSLGPEALAIRIQAYAAKHDAARVKDLAAKFLAEYPTHPFAAHVPAMIKDAIR